MFFGNLPSTWFCDSLDELSYALIAGGNLIKKVLFPAVVLALVSVLANMIHFFLGLPIIAAFLIWYQRAPDPTDLLWLPVVILVQLIFTAGLALLLSSLTVHFRDLRDILSNILTLWFFATPIIYSIKDAPGLGKQVLNWNPMTHLMVSYQ